MKTKPPVKVAIFRGRAQKSVKEFPREPWLKWIEDFNREYGAAGLQAKLLPAAKGRAPR